MNRTVLFALFFNLFLQSCLKDNVITSQAQLKLDTTAIRNFLKQNDTSAIKTPSGFWYVIDTLGVGVYPVLSDSVVISYDVKLLSSSNLIDNVTSSIVHLSNSISGVQQGLLLLPAGSYGKLYIPSGLAFGSNAHVLSSKNIVPANSNLIYEIKLKGVYSSKLAGDIQAIDTYLQSQSIVPRNDPSSEIRYTIDELGSSGPPPAPTDSISVTYTVKILNSDTLFKSVTTPVLLALKDQITGWRIMLPQTPQGSTMTMYIPSGYGYGSNMNSLGILPNSNLIYQVKLINVIPH